jgi:hypothetical protein
MLTRPYSKLYTHRPARTQTCINSLTRSCGCRECQGAQAGGKLPWSSVQGWSLRVSVQDIFAFVFMSVHVCLYFICICLSSSYAYLFHPYLFVRVLFSPPCSYAAHVCHGVQFVCMFVIGTIRANTCARGPMCPALVIFLRCTYVRPWDEHIRVLTCFSKHCASLYALSRGFKHAHCQNLGLIHKVSWHIIFWSDT